MPFRFAQLDIHDVILVEAKAFSDNRGFLVETYKYSEFAGNGIPERFVQDNFTYSKRHVLRGLHYQKNPKAQGKIVTVLHGRIFDVAVDIRIGSPTYRKWLSVELSDEHRNMLYIPPGFAHGFCVLSAEANVVYKSTEQYSPDFDRGIIWNDQDLAIEWPISSPILSAKDAALPALRQADNNFRFDE
jgi:dTDP-4-dehydrorhamnose 3,5-epimerase